MRRLAMVLGIMTGLASFPATAGTQEVTDTLPPRVVKEVKPTYTAAARAEGIEGTVTLDCTVQPDGTTADVRVVKSLHHELDKEAQSALAEWRFSPGTKAGKPVPVRVTVEISFALATDRTAHRGPGLDSPEVHRPVDGVTTPTLVHEVKPRYAPEAMRAGVQGRVKLECVVLSDGTVGDVRVVEKMHPLQDGEAVRSLQQWTFKPGTKDGVAVPVRVEVEMTFALGSGPRRNPANP